VSRPSNDRLTPLRATQIFRFDEASITAPIGARVWRTRSEAVDSFTSVATAHWEMVVVKQRGRASLFVRGPETRASSVAVPEDAEFLGVEFRLGTFMPQLPASHLVDGAIALEASGTRSFWLNGSAWELPTYNNVDVFLRRLARKGVVARDSTVAAALRGRSTGHSTRSVQRRIRSTTGLTHTLITQIERAQRAARLLECGATILDVVERAGYADQPHLGRSLRRFLGHTPARIRRESCAAAIG
jgi:hypothetical protein